MIAVLLVFKTNQNKMSQMNGQNLAENLRKRNDYLDKKKYRIFFDLNETVSPLQIRRDCTNNRSHLSFYEKTRQKI